MTVALVFLGIDSTLIGLLLLLYAYISPIIFKNKKQLKQDA